MDLLVLLDHVIFTTFHGKGATLAPKWLSPKSQIEDRNLQSRISNIILEIIPIFENERIATKNEH